MGAATGRGRELPHGVKGLSRLLSNGDIQSPKTGPMTEWKLHTKRTASSSQVAFSLNYLQCTAVTPTHSTQFMQYVN